MPRKPKRRMNAAEIAFDLAARRVKAREAAGGQRAAARAAERDPKQWGMNVEALEQQEDVDVTQSIRGGHAAARRDDVFDRLLARQALSQGAHQAVRRLDADMTERRGEGERSPGEKVDGSGSRDLVSQRMIDAGDRVEAVLRLVGRRDAALLRELLEPRQVMVTAEHERWRQVVVVFTGETERNAQGAVLRSACENLLLAYRDADNMPRRAA